MWKQRNFKLEVYFLFIITGKITPRSHEYDYRQNGPFPWAISEWAISEWAISEWAISVGHFRMGHFRGPFQNGPFPWAISEWAISVGHFRGPFQNGPFPWCFEPRSESEALCNVFTFFFVNWNVLIHMQTELIFT